MDSSSENRPRPDEAAGGEAKQAVPETQQAGAVRAGRGWLGCTLLGSAAIVLAALGGWAAWQRWGPVPELPEIELCILRLEWSKAERAARRYLSRHPDEPEAIMLLARVWAGQGNYIQCAQLLQQRIVPESRHGPEALLRAAQAWLAANYRRRAEGAALKCIELEPATLDALRAQQACRRLLCTIYALELRREELRRVAWQMHEHALPAERHEPLGMMLRAEWEIVEPGRSIPAFEDALKADPNDWLSRRALGLYQLEDGLTQQARANLYRCLQAAPENLLMWHAWLECLHRTGDIFGLQNAVERLPDSAAAKGIFWFYRAMAAERDGKLQYALEWVERARQLEPANGEYWHRLGMLLMRTGKRVEGKKWLERSHKYQEARTKLNDAFSEYKSVWWLQPEGRPATAYRVAHAYEQLGWHRFAIAWYKVALVEDPAHELSIAGLERVQRLLAAAAGQ